MAAPAPGGPPVGKAELLAIEKEALRYAMRSKNVDWNFFYYIETNYPAVLSFYRRPFSFLSSVLDGQTEFGEVVVSLANARNEDRFRDALLGCLPPRVVRQGDVLRPRDEQFRFVLDRITTAQIEEMISQFEHEISDPRAGATFMNNANIILDALDSEIERRQQSRDYAAFVQSGLHNHIAQNSLSMGGQDVAKLIGKHVSDHALSFHPRPVTSRIPNELPARDLHQLSAGINGPGAGLSAGMNRLSIGPSASAAAAASPSGMGRYHAIPVAPLIPRASLAGELSRLSAAMSSSAAAAPMPISQVRAQLKRLLELAGDDEDRGESNKASKHF